jgi:hypothetical protein
VIDMQNRYRCATFVVCLLVVGLVAAPLSAAHALQGKGVTMTMTMTTTSPGQPPSVMVVEKLAVSSTGLVRSDVLPDGSGTPRPAPTGDRPPMLVPGTYALRKKGGDTTYVIDPSQKKYWAVVMPNMQKAIGHLNYTNVEVSATRVQPDSTIEGIPVQHWRVIDNATIEKRTASKSTFDVYTAPGFDVSLGDEFNPGRMAAVGGDSAYNAKRTAAWTQALHGIPLMMLTQTEILVYQGKPMSMGMTMKASNISRGDPPASLFAMPAGYTLVHSAQ